MTEKRFKVAVYDDKAINGFAVLDLQKPNSSKRLEYENVYIGSKAGCEIVCNFGNNLAEENEELKHNNKMLSMKMSEVYTKYCLLKEFSEDTNPNDAVKRVLSELMQITKEYR